VDNAEPARVEDLAQLIARIKDTYSVSESEIARRIGVSAAAVNGWANRTRGNKRGPARETLRKLAAAFPKITEAEVFAAAGRRSPGPLSPEAEERIQALYRDLTAEQQAMFETQIRAVVEMNKSGQ
jgi:transcriptional regulator with XRE-family HTH domain